jgi:toxin-antitoxin system PIN domain toxin
VIAVDTNLLVYAHRASTPEHRRARQAIERAAEDSRGWGIAIATVGEFWSVVTHATASGRPSTAKEAAAFLRRLNESADMQIWSPGKGFGERLLQLAVDLDVAGVRVFDLQIALTALEHGAHEIWTHDGNFTRVPGIRLHDPLTETASR